MPIKITRRELLEAVVGSTLLSSPDSLVGEERSVSSRVDSRTFPSVFMAWNSAEDKLEINQTQVDLRHDLIFSSPSYLGLRWERGESGLSSDLDSKSIAIARSRKSKFIQQNPNLVLLAEVRYRDAHASFLPENHPAWKRDAAGKRIVGWEEGQYYLLDFAQPEFRGHIVRQSVAITQAGLFDGIMLDWWEDDSPRLTLIKELRAAIGNEKLILVNSNDHTIPNTAQYINGIFMECYRSKTVEDWKRIEETLVWAQINLRKPHIICLETWFDKSRMDFNRMRATTCLSLTLSDGYALFSDPNDLPTPDHLHDWYSFWNKSLGRHTSSGFRLSSGAVRREFENGTAVYNPIFGKLLTLTFREERKSLRTDRVSKVHELPAFDGDIFLGVK